MKISTRDFEKGRRRETFCKKCDANFESCHGSPGDTCPDCEECELISLEDAHEDGLVIVEDPNPIKKKRTKKSVD